MNTLALCHVGIFFYYIVGCPPGFFLDTSTKHCRECDVGSYQDTEGQVTCQSCPSGYTTKSKSSDSVNACYRVKAVDDEGKKKIVLFFICLINAWKIVPRSM